MSVRIFLKTRNRLKTYQKRYNLDNHDRILQNFVKSRDRIYARQNNYGKNKRMSDPSYKLITKTRTRSWHALKGNNKASSRKKMSGIDIVLYQKWLELQTTHEMKVSKSVFDQVKPICSFVVSKDD